MAQLKTVQKAQKNQGTCSRCGQELNAGSPYRYWRPGFRSRAKITRCLKPECTPKRSELTTSKLSAAFAAQENAEDAIHAATTIADVVQAVEDCEAEARDVAQEYEDSVEAAPMLEDQVRDTIDALETWADALSGFSPEEPEDDDDDSTKDEALEEAKSAAFELVGDLEA
jgi:hypothetical protein